VRWSVAAAPEPAVEERKWGAAAMDDGSRAARECVQAVREL
jgi:hypothetical protein